MKKIKALIGAAVVATASVAVWAGNASASDPSTSAVYDVNSTTWTASGSSTPILYVKSVECDSKSETVIGGGVIDNDASSGTPANGDFFSVVSTAPQYGGANAKDTWTVIVRLDGTSPSRTYSATAYAICAK